MTGPLNRLAGMNSSQTSASKWRQRKAGMAGEESNIGHLNHPKGTNHGLN